MPNIPQKCQILAEKIQHLFEKGLPVDQHVLHYMESTFSAHDIDTLEAVIQNPFDCERDPLIELLYFPDESIQVQLEDFLESAAFEENDEPAIIGHLSPALGETLFHFPGNPSGWKLQTPLDGARAFLYRLNISRNLDRRLLAALRAVAGHADQNRCKVKIRNAKFDRDRKKIDCLEAFFLKSDPNLEGFFERFSFILHFLGEWKDDSSLFDALARKKGLYIRQLQQASQLDSLHNGRNIETLMALGVRSPHLDRHDITEKIVLIDDISLAIFGRTVYGDEFSV
jgi:hypothetical protein